MLSSGDRLVDLVKEGIDCVVRAGQPRDSSLIARKLADLPEIICASPEYLDRHGTPKHPRDLEQHQGIGFFSRGNEYRYPFSVVVDRSEEHTSELQSIMRNSYDVCCLKKK